jgi:hypothetical protein
LQPAGNLQDHEGQKVIHLEPSEFAGKTVNVKLVSEHIHLDGMDHVAEVEDYWDRVTGGSWMFADGNPAAMVYGMRSGFSGGKIPLDDQVVYVKIGPFGHLLHTSEIVGVA